MLWVVGIFRLLARRRKTIILGENNQYVGGLELESS